jgi:hypothetical protein
MGYNRDAGCPTMRTIFGRLVTTGKRERRWL